MLTSMKNCPRHSHTVVVPTCRHITQMAEKGVEPGKAFTAWFYSVEDGSPWWVLIYCNECVKKYEYLPENQKYFGEEAKPLEIYRYTAPSAEYVIHAVNVAIS